jgi:cytoskeletal protein CcmA (bactofilin family)
LKEDNVKMIKSIKTKAISFVVIFALITGVAPTIVHAETGYVSNASQLASLIDPTNEKTAVQDNKITILENITFNGGINIDHADITIDLDGYVITIDKNEANGIGLSLDDHSTLNIIDDVPGSALNVNSEYEGVVINGFSRAEVSNIYSTHYGIQIENGSEIIVQNLLGPYKPHTSSTGIRSYGYGTKATVLGDIKGYFRGAYASNGSFISVDGDIDADGNQGLISENDSSEVHVKGDVHGINQTILVKDYAKASVDGNVTAKGGIAILASYGQINIGGDIAAVGNGDYRGIDISSTKLDIQGDIDLDNYTWGIDLSDNSSVSIDGNINTKETTYAIGGIGAGDSVTVNGNVIGDVYQESGELTIDGNLVGALTASGKFIINGNSGSVDVGTNGYVKGDVNGNVIINTYDANLETEGSVFGWVSALTPSNVSITKDIIAPDSIWYGIYATNDAFVKVGGDIILKYYSSWAVEAYNGANIVIDGVINAREYLKINSISKTIYDFTQPTTKIGYRDYSNGATHVFVKDNGSLPPKYTAPKKIDISKAITLPIKNQVFSGAFKTPKVTVKYGNKTLVRNVDYTLKYSNNKRIGKASLEISGIGNNYIGKKIVSFKIIPKSTKFKIIKIGKKRVSLNWRKVTGITKYQIQYKQTKTKKWKNKYISAQNAKLTIKKLKKGKKYQFKIRTYKVVNNVKYYSAWSRVKTSKKIKSWL